MIRSTTSRYGLVAWRDKQELEEVLPIYPFMTYDASQLSKSEKFPLHFKYKCISSLIIRLFYFAALVSQALIFTTQFSQSISVPSMHHLLTAMCVSFNCHLGNPVASRTLLCSRLTDHSNEVDSCWPSESMTHSIQGDTQSQGTINHSILQPAG